MPLNSRSALALGLSSILCAVSLAHSEEVEGVSVQKNAIGQVVGAEYRGGETLGAAKLHKHPRLEYLAVPWGAELTGEDVAQLAKLTKLRHLEIGFVGLGSEYVTIEGNMAALGNLKDLTWLHLNKEGLSDKDMEFVASLPCITQLHFNANPDGKKKPALTDRSADYISQAKTLESVWAHDSGMLTDAFVSKLAGGLPNLEHLDLSSSRLTNESLRSLGTHSRKLKWLDIGSELFTDEGVQHLGKNKQLEWLWLCSGTLTGKSIETIAGLKHLRRLELPNAEVADEDVQKLAALNKLEILALRSPELTDEQFAMFANHPTLESAFINGSKLTMEKTLEVVKTIPNLRHLSIGSNRDLNKAVSGYLRRNR